ncbi:hypothetical protein [Fibrella aquatilis]|uniref:Uncharacterized protein n=1 Tax=Fibrella aquatilis TaxID=2817059 RepID=A0A939G273_9BACT|nr:hypothetical protein [Fibrella aquatilis]MBO0929803.1 hypothetical protein [Fibrella aquatilis]
MWYFILKQDDLRSEPYRALQKQASLTEVEPFNEPFDNLVVFTVDNYATFVDALDLEGLRYDVVNERPTRDALLARLRSE